MLALLAGVVLGFVGSIPAAGPLLALVIARGLDARQRDALALALGGALAESLYVAMAFWGLGQLFEREAAVLRWAAPVSGGMLIVLGSLMLRRRQRARQAKSGAATFAGHFALGFSIVGLNPAFLATWSVVASALLSTGFAFARADAAPALATGAFVGVALWFACVARLAQRQRNHFDVRRVELAVRVLGAVVVVFGAWLVVSAVLG